VGSEMCIRDRVICVLLSAKSVVLSSQFTVKMVIAHRKS
jgi:hypothetical protein